MKLLSWTQDVVVAVPQTLPEPKPKRKYSLLPVLIVLFLISYGLMCLLAVEQDRTIAAQRSLIKSLVSDSTELSSLKGKLIQKQYAQAQTQAKAGTGSRGQTPSSQGPASQAPMTQAPMGRAPLTQAPMTQAPMTQAPMTQAPITQDTPRGNAQNSHNAGKPRKAVPQKPPLGIADIVDGRRIVKTI